MYYRLLIILFLIIIACRKELDINDFSDDFGYYKPELRIEAVILPSDNTAIIRIDRSTRLDEGINNDGYYNCRDDDEDWNYYYCDSTHTSYEQRCACEQECNAINIEGCDALDASQYHCTLHLYKCENGMDSLITFSNKNDCICENSKCVTDDVGSDGKSFDEKNIFGISIGLDQDGSEGDGKPNCGEPNIDEFDEILPGIHVDECVVNIIHSSDTCQFIYDENAGIFFGEQKSKLSIFDSDIISYGAWIPDTNACSINFTHYDEEYKFIANCIQEFGFESTGVITATDILRRPVIFYKALQLDSLMECAKHENNDDIFNCMKTFDTDSLVFIDLPSDPINQDSLNNLAVLLEIDIQQLVDHQLNYASLLETNKYQAVQYVMDGGNGEWFYWHGHIDAVTSNEQIINDKICLSSEVVIGYDYAGKRSTKYKYDIFTFSPGYENYYFYDQLDLADPVRTNLRDENGKTIMGGFGSISRNTIYIEILNLDSLITY